MKETECRFKKYTFNALTGELESHCSTFKEYLEEQLALGRIGIPKENTTTNNGDKHMRYKEIMGRSGSVGLFVDRHIKVYYDLYEDGPLRRHVRHSVVVEKQPFIAARFFFSSAAEAEQAVHDITHYLACPCEDMMRVKDECGDGE